MKDSVHAIRVSTAILFLLFPLMSGCHNNKPDPARALAEKVAAVGCFSSDIEKDLADVGQRLESLGEDESQNADSALVMLMGYYLGEHNHEQLVAEIARRGKRMRPLLEREREKPASIGTCAPSLDKQAVRGDAEWLISAIDKGERWN
jgi:hypothetical protein